MVTSGEMIQRNKQGGAKRLVPLSFCQLLLVFPQRNLAHSHGPKFFCRTTETSQCVRAPRPVSTMEGRPFVRQPRGGGGGGGGETSDRCRYLCCGVCRYKDCSHELFCLFTARSCNPGRTNCDGFSASGTAVRSLPAAWVSFDGVHFDAFPHCSQESQSRSHTCYLQQTSSCMATSKAVSH